MFCVSRPIPVRPVIVERIVLIVTVEECAGILRAMDPYRVCGLLVWMPTCSVPPRSFVLAASWATWASRRTRRAHRVEVHCLEVPCAGAPDIADGL